MGINWKPAPGGPVRVLRRNKRIDIDKAHRLSGRDRVRPLVSFSDKLRAHPLFETENIFMHNLQIALKLHERGVMHEVHKNWSRQPRTRRWVIDDLYGAVQKGGRR